MSKPSSALAISLGLSLLFFFAFEGEAVTLKQWPKNPQGVSEAPRFEDSLETVNKRAEKIADIGLGYRQYNFWWSALEGSGLASSPTPIDCPQGYQLFPKDQAEKNRLQTRRYRCVNLSMIAEFDKRMALDEQLGLQTGVVLWSSPEVYRYQGCEGFPFGGIQLKEGCVPRDDAMDDFYDYVTFLASHYNGQNGVGRIRHFIVWNEIASDGWFDYSPVVPKKNALTAENIDKRINKYAQMMRLAHEAVANHTDDALVYVSTDRLWDKGMHAGHMGTRILLAGLWEKLGLSIDWAVAVHPYGDPTESGRKDAYSFANLDMVSRFQADRLSERGHPDPQQAPQYTLIASEQGWTTSYSQKDRSRFICASYDQVLSYGNVVAIAHNYFHSVEPGSDTNEGTSNQGGFYGLLPYWVKRDLSDMHLSETGQAYMSTNPELWTTSSEHYCCQQFDYGCPLSRVERFSSLYQFYTTFNRKYLRTSVTTEGDGVEAWWRRITVGEILKINEPDTIPLYECLVGDRDYMISHDFNCEGQKKSKPHRIGYLWNGPGPGRLPLYRCYNGRDHYTSTNAECTVEGWHSKRHKNGWVEALMGYIGVSNPEST